MRTFLSLLLILGSIVSSYGQSSKLKKMKFRDYGLEISLPKQWEIKKPEHDKTQVFQTHYRDDFEKTYMSTISVLFIYTKIDHPFSKDTILYRHLSGPYLVNGKPVSVSPFTIKSENSYPSICYTYDYVSNQTAFTNIVALFIGNGCTYQFNISVQKERYEFYIDTIRKILESIKIKI